jgi:hypothetical protein
LLSPELPWTDEEILEKVEELESFTKKEYQLEMKD